VHYKTNWWLNSLY